MVGEEKKLLFSSAGTVEVQSHTPNPSTALSEAADTSAETTEVQLSAPDTVAAASGDGDTSVE